MLRQRAITIFSCALYLLLNRGFPADDQSIDLEQMMAFRTHHCTATGVQHDSGFIRQLVQHGGFTLPKAVFALHIRYSGNVGAAALFDNPHGIEKTVPELL